MRSILLAVVKLLPLSSPAWSQDESLDTSATFEAKGSVLAAGALNGQRLATGEAAPNIGQTQAAPLMTIDELVDTIVMPAMSERLVAYVYSDELVIQHSPTD